MRGVLLFLFSVVSVAHARDDFDQQSAAKDRLAIVRNERDSTAAELAFESKNGNTGKTEQLKKDLEALNKELERLANPKKQQHTVVIREARTRVEQPEAISKQTEPLAYEPWDIFNDFGRKK